MTNKITLTEGQLHDIIYEAISEAFDEKKYLERQKARQWFMYQYADDNATVDDNRVAADCCKLLKDNPHLVISRGHNFVKLPNNCCVGLCNPAINDGDFSLWEIIYPDGSVWDGEGIDPKIDDAMQQELYKHVIQ